MRATAANGIWRASIRMKASNSKREAVQASGKVSFDQAHRAIGQLHARRAHLQMALVLEEVQVPIALGHRVMHRMHTLMARNLKAATWLEVNQHGQFLGRLVKLYRRHCPWRCNSKGSFKQLGSHQFSHPVDQHGVSLPTQISREATGATYR
jgi:hypothetical protein